jgi:ABC-type Fe3+ transport system permease subunit
MGAVAAMAIVGLAVGVPGVWAGVEIGRGLAADHDGRFVTGGLGLRSVGVTVVVAGLIGMLAMALAWPAAWVIGRGGGGGRWSLLLMAPLLLPQYLVYSGWDLLRDPGSSVGDWLARQPGWMSIWAGYALAVGGMALWAWPIAVIPLAAGIRRLGAPALEAARLETRSGARMARVVVGQMRGAVLASAGLVALVCLGSAVPLHLAQIPTHAIELWLLLDLTPPGERWRVWLAAWPLGVLAVVGAGVVVLVARAGEGSDRPLGEEAPPPRAGRAPGVGAPRSPVGVAGAAGGSEVVAGKGVAWSRPRWHGVGVLAWGIWVLATLVPLGLYLRVTSVGAIGRFLGEMGRAIGASVQVAGLVAAGAMGLCVAVAAMASAGRRWRRVALALVGVMAVAGLVPGALLGSVTLRAWSAAAVGWAGAAGGWVADSLVIVALAHLARFGVVAALVGWWLGRLEPRELGEIRALEGAGVGGWLRAAGWPMAPGALAAGVACFALSFHEIEAAVIVAPPAIGQGLPAMMLDFLHRTYLERLGAGAVLMLGVGLGAGALCAWLGGRLFLPRVNPPRPDGHK